MLSINKKNNRAHRRKERMKESPSLRMFQASPSINSVTQNYVPRSPGFWITLKATNIHLKPLPSINIIYSSNKQCSENFNFFPRINHPFLI